MDTETNTPENPDLRFPEWEGEYRTAVLETDEGKLPERLNAAEDAIFRRFQALTDSPEHSVERIAIEDAIRALRVIQRDVLGYPAWEGELGPPEGET